MRRLIAFFISLATLIVVVAVNVLPYIGSNAKLNLETDLKYGLDYRGGYEVLYEVERTDGRNLSQSKVDSIINVMTTQINSVGITNPRVTLETGNSKRNETAGEEAKFIRVSVPVTTNASISSLTSLIESNNVITFRAEDGTLLGRGEDLLNEKKFTSVSSEGHLSRITLNFTKAGYETFLTYASETSVSGSGNAEEGTTGNVVIWLGYNGDDIDLIDKFERETDSFAEYNSYHENVTKYGINVLTMDQKVIYNRYLSKIVGYTTFTLGETNIPNNLHAYSEEDKTITLSNFTYTSEQANSIVENINRGEILDYKLHQISMAKIPAALASDALLMAAIAFIVGLVLICAMLIVMYRLSGVAASFALIAHTAISVFLYKSFGGIFSPVIFIALLISVAIAVDAIIIMFERTKDEMYKGKTVERAFSESSKKVNSAVLDANIVTFLISIVIFIFGVQEIQSAATMLAISSASIIVVIILLIKLLANCLFKSEVFKGKYGFFIPDKQNIPDVQKGEHQTNFGKFTKVNFFKNAKNLCKGVAGVAGLAVLAGLIFLGVGGSPFNLNSDYKEYTKIAVQTNLDKEDKNNIFSGREFSIYLLDEFDIKADYSGTTADIKYYNSSKITAAESEVAFTSYVIEFYDTLDNDTIDKITTALQKFTNTAKQLNEENKQINKELENADQYLFTFTINTAQNYSYKNIIGNTFLVIGVSLAIILIYVSIRFKYTYALAALAGVSIDIIVTFALVVLFHLELSVLTLVTIALISCYSINDKIIIFDRIRENVIGARKKVFTHDERVEFANRSLQQTAYRGLIVIAATLITLLIVAIVGGSSILNISAILIIAIITSAFTSTIVCPLLWVFFDDRLTLKNQNKKPRRDKKKTNIGEVQEQVFIGIND